MKYPKYTDNLEDTMAVTMAKIKKNHCNIFSLFDIP